MSKNDKIIILGEETGETFDIATLFQVLLEELKRAFKEKILATNT